MFPNVLNYGFAIIKILSFVLSQWLCRTNLALNCKLKLKLRERVVKRTITIITNSILKKDLKLNFILHW